uniref:Major facilitator superfamily (MFS) profile domain-containing protein n=2 Tax=Lutzomyia longipalpis TaxID=7200 RepID=A0A1B0CVT2_LUTLO
MNIILNSLGNTFKWKLLKSRRAAVTILSFIGLLLALVNSVSLSVVIVAMTNEVNKTLENGTVVLEREFQWDSKEQGLVLSAYYYGFLWTQLLGGMLASKFGGHIVFGIGNGLAACIMLLLPWMANLGIYYFVAGRIILGSLSGVVIPAVQEIFSKWAPIHERTTMLGIALSGTQSGSFTAFLLSGYFVQLLGWQSVFYISENSFLVQQEGTMYIAWARGQDDFDLVDSLNMDELHPKSKWCSNDAALAG